MHHCTLMMINDALTHRQRIPLLDDGKPVSLLANGLNACRMDWVLLEFSPEPKDECPEIVPVPNVLGTPDIPEQCPRINYFPCTASQLCKEEPLCRGKTDLHTPAMDTASCKVNPEGTCLNHPRPCPLIDSPEDSTYSGKEFLGSKRLGEIVIRTKVEGPDLVPFISTCRDDDDRRTRVSGTVRKYCPSIDEGKTNIEQEDAEVPMAEELLCLTAVRCSLDGVSICSENLPDEAPQHSIVFCNEDSMWTNSCFHHVPYSTSSSTQCAGSWKTPYHWNTMADDAEHQSTTSDAAFWDGLVAETKGPPPDTGSAVPGIISSLLEEPVDLEAIDRAVSAIIQHDPDFSSQHFVAQVEALYLQIETLLRSGNSALLDRAISPAFRTTWDGLVQRWSSDGTVSLFDAHALPHVTIAAAFADDHHDIIAVDLLVNEWETFLRQRISQRWVFVRTRSDSPDAALWNTPRCANCGAPIPDPAPAVCQFCNAPLANTFFPWVLASERDFPAPELSNLVHHFSFDRAKLTDGIFAIHELDSTFTPQGVLPQLGEIVHCVRESIRTGSDASLLPHLSVGGARWWAQVHGDLHLSPDAPQLEAEKDPSLSIVAAYADDNIEILTMKVGDTAIMTGDGTTNPSLLFRFIRLHITDIASGKARQRTCPNCGAPSSPTAESHTCPYCGFDLAESAGSWKLDCMYPILIVPAELP